MTLSTPEDLAREIEGCEEEDGYCDRHPALTWPCNDSSVRYYAAHVRNIQRMSASDAIRKAADHFAAGARVQEHLSRGTVATLLRDMAHLIDMGDDGLTDSERQRLADEWAACEGSAMTVEQYRQTKEGK